jgi:hypothetical protein
LQEIRNSTLSLSHRMKSCRAFVYGKQSPDCSKVDFLSLLFPFTVPNIRNFTPTNMLNWYGSTTKEEKIRQSVQGCQIRCITFSVSTHGLFTYLLLVCRPLYCLIHHLLNDFLHFQARRSPNPLFCKLAAPISQDMFHNLQIQGRHKQKEKHIIVVYHLPTSRFG